MSTVGDGSLNHWKLYVLDSGVRPRVFRDGPQSGRRSASPVSDGENGEIGRKNLAAPGIGRRGFFLYELSSVLDRVVIDFAY